MLIKTQRNRDFERFQTEIRLNSFFMSMLEGDIQQHRSHVLSDDAEKQLASTQYFVSLLSGECLPSIFI